MPASGQQWTSLEELKAGGHRTQMRELEPNLFVVTVEPAVGIGHHAYVLVTRNGNLLWDPNGYLDDDGVNRVRELGDVAAIATSHPHMFGVQVAWSRALGGAPVLVSAPDIGWVARPDPVISAWKGPYEVVPGVTLLQPGGHFPGSAVVHWADGADGRGVLLSGDTMPFDRLYDNFGGTIDADARAIARRSCDRYMGWVRGDYDHLT
jgi:hypothetical protein